MWDSAPPSGGGLNLIDTLSGEAIVAMETVGRTLAIATDDSVVRFAGYSGEDIQIQQDTEGISSNHGPLSRNTFRRFEEFVAMLTDRGPYAVGEGGITPIGVKVEPEFDDTNRTVVVDWSIGYHRGRRELWFAVRRTADFNIISVYVYNVRLQSWSGPFTYPFAGILDLARFEDASGSEFLMGGFSDGFVRHMDIGTLDDVLADNTGGTAYTMTAELPPIFFETGPAVLKSLRHMLLQADLPAAAALQIQRSFDNEAFVVEGTLSGTGGVVEAFRQDMNGQGNRLRIRFIDASSTIPIVNGFQLLANNLQRVDV